MLLAVCLCTNGFVGFVGIIVLYLDYCFWATPFGTQDLLPAVVRGLYSALPETWSSLQVLPSIL